MTYDHCVSFWVNIHQESAKAVHNTRTSETPHNTVNAEGDGNQAKDMKGVTKKLVKRGEITHHDES